MTIQLYGVLAQLAGSAQIEIPFRANVHSLRNEIEAHFPQLGGQMYRVAVDLILVDDQCVLTGKEEIALLPPFAGG